jgi:predicted anti-sigma-YlaC factor YlaD
VFAPRHDKAAEYRRLAEESRAFAMHISLPEVRKQFLKMAEHWEMLAEVAEQRQQLRVPQSNEPRSDS